MQECLNLWVQPNISVERVKVDTARCLGPDLASRQARTSAAAGRRGAALAAALRPSDDAGSQERRRLARRTRLQQQTALQRTQVVLRGDHCLQQT